MKLTEDELSAFGMSLQLANVLPSDIYEVLQAPFIPVPSRLYFPACSEKKPLSGLRFAVKDVFDVAGVQTSNCSRAYSALYSAASKTAPCVQKLLAAGAVPIGKTNTAQFASGAHPTDWVDSHCSFNPRGDEYQSPSMSSVGSASTMAAYEWVDFALGTDTFGSVIMSAAAAGIFALRPTKGIQDLEGVIPMSHHLDTAGFFARDIETSVKVARAWLGDNVPCEPRNERPEIIYPEDLFPFENSIYQRAVENFVTHLQRFTGGRFTRTKLDQRWETSGQGDGRALSDYL